MVLFLAMNPISEACTASAECWTLNVEVGDELIGSSIVILNVAESRISTALPFWEAYC